MPLIEIKNLKKDYINEELVTSVLHGVTFSIRKGEFVAIMGPSGSGKSTLMHIIGFLDRPTGGEFLFEGRDTSKFEDDYLAELRNERIGFVFQTFNLLARTTVLDNVKLPLIYSHKKNHDELAKKALEAVGLGHRMDYFTNKISGGEKQRVAIARALVNDPAIIFADEPTGNLDSKSGAVVMNILQKLNNEGRTIVLVTHERDTASYAERIIHLKDGLIIEDNEVEHRKVADGSELVK